MRSFWVILFGSITFVIKFLVGCWHSVLYKRRTYDINDLVAASKCDFNVFDGDWNNHTVNNSASHIKEYIEGTIERLRFVPDNSSQSPLLRY